MKLEKIGIWILIIACIIFGLLLGFHDKIFASAVHFFNEPFKAEVTAYVNPNGNKTSTGKNTIEGLTIAGKPEWEGCVIALYFVNPETGGIGEFYGYRQVTDTGYGHASSLYSGKGTIETGETVDVYFDDYATAKAWGSKQMYIQVIPGKG